MHKTCVILLLKEQKVKLGWRNMRGYGEIYEATRKSFNISGPDNDNRNTSSGSTHRHSDSRAFRAFGSYWNRLRKLLFLRMREPAHGKRKDIRPQEADLRELVL